MKDCSEISAYKNKIITIPNILSFFRLLLVPFIIYFYIKKESIVLTVVVLAISGVTDVVDGMIARRFNMISDFGKALDPVADKLTQMATLYCLVTEFPYMWAALGLLVVKEVFTGFCALLAFKSSGEVVGADWYGKITTVLIYVTSVLHVVWRDIPPYISNQCIGICFGMMVVAFIHYNIQYISIVKKNRKNKV